MTLYVEVQEIYKGDNSDPYINIMSFLLNSSLRNGNMRITIDVFQQFLPDCGIDLTAFVARFNCGVDKKVLLFDSSAHADSMLIALLFNV